MSDITRIIAPKSDQLNADDLQTGERTICIREVRVLGAGQEQPVHIYFDGDDGKPWKPCKTMARLLANLWKSPDTSTWIGKSVRLYNDPDVKWGGAKVGGIRVRAVSHIDDEKIVAISESKQRRKMVKIGVLQVQPERKSKTPEDWVAEYEAGLAECRSLEALSAYQADKQRAKAVDALKGRFPDLHGRVIVANEARYQELSANEGGE